MSEIHYFIPGIPKPQPRPRAFARGGSARVYDPGTAEGWKSHIALALRDSIPETPITCGVSAVLVFYFPRPRSHFGTGRNAEILKASSPVRHTKRPDVDNLVKSVTDCLTTLGLWRDDSQLDRFQASKQYAHGTQKPGLALTLHWETDDD